jgi:D-alanine-D-alanine ligase-like ATP-grasp enzyme
VPHFRGQELYTFPLGNTFGDFTSNEREIMNTLVKNLRNHLGVSHYLKSDLVVNPRGKVYLLGVESSPNLKPDSHFSQVCELAGVKPHDVIHHILEQTLQ